MGKWSGKIEGLMWEVFSPSPILPPPPTVFALVPTFSQTKSNQHAKKHNEMFAKQTNAWVVQWSLINIWCVK